MRRRLLPIFLLLLAAAPASQRAAPAFPQAWLGHWKGPLELDSPRGKQSLKMELIVAPTDDAKRFTWTIVYDGDAGRQERKYHLEVVDAAKGQYVIDENNGIRLPATLVHGDTLVSAFDVSGTTLVSTDRLLPDGSLFSEITSTRITGDADANGQVIARKVTAVQRAVMKRE